MRLQGQVALVTGGAKGIGKAIAHAFLKEGAGVAIVDCDREAGIRSRDELGPLGSIQYIEADTADASRSAQVLARVQEAFSRLDILVNNAAIYLAEAEELEDDAWERLLRVNLTAYQDYALQAARLMKSSGGGSIINICSVHRLISDSKSMAYAVAKSGVYQLTRSLAIKLASHNIQVNSISPGFVRTSMGVVDGIDETETEEFKINYLQSGRIPLGRVAVPEEVAAAALFLASRECRYMTGADLVVDGGLTLTL